MAAALSWQVAADQPPQWPQQALDKVDVALGQYQRQAAAQQLSGVVISVHDGDSLRVRDVHGRVHRIRLAFVDAPEIGQAHGLASRDGLRRHLLGQQVTISVLERDRYRRQVAQIWLGDTDISLWQLQQGAAWHYRSIAKNKQNSAAYARYQAAEFNAALQIHTREASLIVEQFSSEWFSKHRFHEGGDISRKSSDGFAGYALKKMRDELKMGASSDAR